MEKKWEKLKEFWLLVARIELDWIAYKMVSFMKETYKMRAQREQTAHDE